MRDRERFINTMEYKSVDRVPNHELGVWPQTISRWEKERLKTSELHWGWFVGEEYFNMDRREFIPVNYEMIPPFEQKVLEKTDRYEIVQRPTGIVTKALIEGTVGGVRMSMDQYLKFPVEKPEDFKELKKRYIANLPKDHSRNERNSKKSSGFQILQLILHGSLNRFYLPT